MAKAIHTSSIIPVRTARHLGGRIISFVIFFIALALAGIGLGAAIDLVASYLGTAAAALIVVSPVALLSCLR